MIMYDAARGSFSPDGSKIAYNKDSQDNATWKRYTGGRAQEIFMYDFKTNEETNITNYNGSDRIPMWIGDKIYFSSDRDRVLNIYAYDTGTGTNEQITKHTEYDVRHPSEGSNKIVYELGGDIWLLDLVSKESKKVPIQILADMEETRPYMKDISKDITRIDISPTGKRALIVAAVRSLLFLQPKALQETYQITAAPGTKMQYGPPTVNALPTCQIKPVNMRFTL